MFEELLERGGASATQLAAGADVTRQAVVKHLQVLAAAGLAVAERSGREVRYRAIPGALHDAAAWMVDAGAAWDRRLARLRRKLEAASGAPVDDQGLQGAPDATRTVRDR